MNSVNAVVVDNNKNIFVTGDFSSIGEVPANNVAEFSEGKWRPLGAGLKLAGCNLTLDSKGNLYASSHFDPAGRNNLVKWNGVSWGPVDTNITRLTYISAMLIDNSDNLYVGGGFDSIGGFPAHNIAKWDGLRWSALDSGLNSGVGALLADDKGNLFVGGGFDSAGSLWSPGAAIWDGVKWNSMSSSWKSFTRGGSQITSFAFSEVGVLYAGGKFSNEQTNYDSNYAVWKNGKWSGFDLGVNKQINALASYKNGTICICGSFDHIESSTPSWDVPVGELSDKIAVWNGNEWNTFGSSIFMSSPSYNDWTVNVNAMVACDSFIIVGGNFYKAGGIVSPGLAKFKIKDNNAIKSNQPTSFLSENVRYYLTKSSLLIISNIKIHDNIAIYSLSGRCLRKAKGIFRLDLSNFAHQPLFIQIIRDKRPISSKLLVIP